MYTKNSPNRAQSAAVLEKLIRNFGHRENVTGFDVGYRWCAGKPTNQFCARIHVEQKIPVAELPKAIVLPNSIDGMPVDVIQGNYKINKATGANYHRSEADVLMGGIPCGRLNAGTGRIAAIVIDNATGNPGILSNWHTLKGFNGQPGDQILQPRPNDRGRCDQEEIGFLSRSMLDRDGDAAVAILNGKRIWLPTVIGASTIIKEVRDSRLGEVLYKSGSTTAHSSARVDGEGIYRVRYQVGPRCI